MGRRSATESTIAVLSLFVRKRYWRQADLAKEAGLTVPALRRTLAELSTWNLLPLERVEKTPDVFLRAPEGWSLGTLLLAGGELEALLRILGRAPRSRERERLMTKLRVRFGRRQALPTAGVVPPPTTVQEETFLDTIAGAIERQRPLRLRYFATSYGAFRDRVVSPQRLYVKTPVRFLAHCHEAKELRWFRLDGVLIAEPSDLLPFVYVPGSVLDAFETESVGAFRSAGKPTAVSFRVRDPEARWVAANLLEGMKADRITDGIRVSLTTTGLIRVARFVVGLSEAAVAESPSLRSVVAEIAAGSLRVNGAPDGHPNEEPLARPKSPARGARARRIGS